MSSTRKRKRSKKRKCFIFIFTKCMTEPKQWIDPSGLSVYFTDPSTHPNVIDFDEDFVIIKDIYPKATVHLLVLPRNPRRRKQHPFVAFKDETFLLKCKNEAAKWRSVAAKMLKDTLYPSSSCSINCNWESQIMVGIHSEPSMEHLHIHVISRDLNSDFLIEKTNYTSFMTSFFVNLDDFPLNKQDEIDRRADLRTVSMKCWRCQNTFKIFRDLKKHLKLEFKNWKTELTSVPDNPLLQREEDENPVSRILPISDEALPKLVVF